MDALAKGNMRRDDTSHKTYEVSKIPIVFENKYPLSKNLEKSIDVIGKVIIPRIKIHAHHINIYCKSIMHLTK
jgi:hypothetical protein